MKRSAITIVTIAMLLSSTTACSSISQAISGSTTCSELADEILSNEAKKSDVHLIDINSVQDESYAPDGSLHDGYTLDFACSGSAADSANNAYDITFQKTENPDGKPFWQFQVQ